MSDEIIIKLQKQFADNLRRKKPKKDIGSRRRQNEPLPRRLKHAGGGIRFFDMGQVRSGSIWLLNNFNEVWDNRIFIPYPLDPSIWYLVWFMYYQDSIDENNAFQTGSYDPFINSLLSDHGSVTSFDSVFREVTKSTGLAFPILVQMDNDFYCANYGDYSRNDRWTSNGFVLNADEENSTTLSITYDFSQQYFGGQFARFDGYIQQPADYYGGADAFVTATFNEDATKVINFSLKNGDKVFLVPSLCVQAAQGGGSGSSAIYGAYFDTRLMPRFFNDPTAIVRSNAGDTTAAANALAHRPADRPLIGYATGMPVSGPEPTITTGGTASSSQDLLFNPTYQRLSAIVVRGSEVFYLWKVIHSTTG